MLTAVGLVACGGGGGGDGSNDEQPTPEATQATPQNDAALAAVGNFVLSVQKEYAGDCATSGAPQDATKLCSTQKGERGNQRAYQLVQMGGQPAYWLIVQQAGQAWTIASNTAIKQGNVSTPGIPWPLTIGAEVVIAGVAPDPCLNVRDAPGLNSNAVDCVKDGTRIKLFAGPQVVDNIAWWQIEGRTGWVSGDFLRYPDAAQ